MNLRAGELISPALRLLSFIIPSSFSMSSDFSSGEEGSAVGESGEGVATA
jgi:hypothetical protein